MKIGTTRLDLFDSSHTGMALKIAFDARSESCMTSMRSNSMTRCTWAVSSNNKSPLYTQIKCFIIYLKKICYHPMETARLVCYLFDNRTVQVGHVEHVG